MDKVVEFFKKIWNKIKEFFKKLWDKIKEICEKIKEKHILKKIKEGIIKFFGWIGSFIRNIINKKKNINVNEELKTIDKKIDKIDKNYEKESDLMVIKLYKKEITRTIKKLAKFENISTRDEQKKINSKRSQLEKLQNRIIEYENKLKDIEPVEEKEKPKDKILNGSKTAGKTIASGTKKTGIAIAKGTKTAGIAIAAGTKKTGGFIKKGAIGAGRTLKKGGSKVVLFTSGVVNKISDNKKKKKAIKLEYKELKDAVREINNKINRAYTAIAKVKDSYSDTKLEELLFLKEKILDLKEDYIRIRSNKRFKQLKLDKKIENVDPNHLSHHGNAIYDLIDYLELTINDVKEGKGKTIVKKEIKEEPKREEKNEVKEIPIELVDFNLVRNSLMKDLNLSKDEINKLKKEVNDIPIKYKKATLLTRITNFFRVSMNTAISLIPFGIFKNKLVATLTSGIILNNRIKAMKSMINGKEIEFIDYESIVDSIKDKRTCILNTGYVLTNTIDDIDDLTSRLTKEYNNNPEALKLIKNLEEMKIDLLEENNKIEKMMTELKETQNKVKQKVA